MQGGMIQSICLLAFFVLSSVISNSSSKSQDLKSDVQHQVSGWYDENSKSGALTETSTSNDEDSSNTFARSQIVSNSDTDDYSKSSAKASVQAHAGAGKGANNPYFSSLNPSGSISAINPGASYAQALVDTQGVSGGNIPGSSNSQAKSYVNTYDSSSSAQAGAQVQISSEGLNSEAFNLNPYKFNSASSSALADAQARALNVGIIPDIFNQNPYTFYGSGAQADAQDQAQALSGNIPGTLNPSLYKPYNLASSAQADAQAQTQGLYEGPSSGINKSPYRSGSSAQANTQAQALSGLSPGLYNLDPYNSGSSAQADAQALLSSGILNQNPYPPNGSGSSLADAQAQALSEGTYPGILNPNLYSLYNSGSSVQTNAQNEALTRGTSSALLNQNPYNPYGSGSSSLANAQAQTLLGDLSPGLASPTPYNSFSSWSPGQVDAGVKAHGLPGERIPGAIDQYPFAPYIPYGSGSSAHADAQTSSGGINPELFYLSPYGSGSSAQVDAYAQASGTSASGFNPSNAHASAQAIANAQALSGYRNSDNGVLDPLLKTGLQIANSRIIPRNEYLLLSQIPGAENAIICSKDGELHNLWSPDDQCLICACIREQGYLTPICVNCAGCMTPTPIIQPIQSPIPEPQVTCDPLPTNAPFQNPLNPCQICVCTSSMDMFGRPDVKVTCEENPMCTNQRTTTARPLIPPQPVPLPPAPLEPLTPIDISIPAPPVPVSWPPIVPPSPSPLPGPAPHESCQPYPPNVPFQHPWDVCQYCVCSQSLTTERVTVEIYCYTKTECCFEPSISIIGPATPPLLPPPIPQTLPIATLKPPQIQIMDQICKFKSFNVEFQHPEDSCRLCTCELFGNFVVPLCKRANSPDCVTPPVTIPIGQIVYIEPKCRYHSPYQPFVDDCYVCTCQPVYNFVIAKCTPQPNCGQIPIYPGNIAIGNAEALAIANAQPIGSDGRFPPTSISGSSQNQAIANALAEAQNYQTNYLNQLLPIPPLPVGQINAGVQFAPSLDLSGTSQALSSAEALAQTGYLNQIPNQIILGDPINLSGGSQAAAAAEALANLNNSPLQNLTPNYFRGNTYPQLLQQPIGSSALPTTDANANSVFNQFPPIIPTPGTLPGSSSASAEAAVNVEQFRLTSPGYAYPRFNLGQQSSLAEAIANANANANSLLSPSGNPYSPRPLFPNYYNPSISNGKTSAVANANSQSSLSPIEISYPVGVFSPALESSSAEAFANANAQSVSPRFNSFLPRPLKNPYNFIRSGNQTEENTSSDENTYVFSPKYSNTVEEIGGKLGTQSSTSLNFKGASVIKSGNPHDLETKSELETQSLIDCQKTGLTPLYLAPMNELKNVAAFDDAQHRGPKWYDTVSSSSSQDSSSDLKSDVTDTSDSSISADSSESTSGSSKVSSQETKEVKRAKQVYRTCTPCPHDMLKNYRNLGIKWICAGYQRARRTFKSECMMRYRNCQDGTMFVKLYEHRCKNDTFHGRHWFYVYRV